MRQIRHVVGLDGVLVERIAAAAADAQILRRLQKRGGDRQPVQLGPQPVDDLRGADLALVERLKRNVDETAVVPPPPPPVKPMTLATAGSALMTFDQRLTESFITAKDASCGPCTPPTIAPVSCCGKNPLGILMISTTFSAMVSSRTTSIKPGIVEHPRSTPIDVQHPVEEPLADPVDTPVLLSFVALSRWAHIIGVVVSEMTIDTTMAVERVTANSRNRRPTMPPISRIGMKTAISDMLMERR